MVTPQSLSQFFPQSVVTPRRKAVWRLLAKQLSDMHRHRNDQSRAVVQADCLWTRWLTQVIARSRHGLCVARGLMCKPGIWLLVDVVAP